MAKSGSRTSRGSQSSMNSVVLIAALAIGAVLFSTTAMKNGGGGGGSDVVLDPNLDTDGDGVIEANELVTVAKPAQLNNDLDLDGDGIVEDHELDENFFARHRVSLLCASTSVIILFAVLYMQWKAMKEEAKEAKEAKAAADKEAKEAKAAEKAAADSRQQLLDEWGASMSGGRARTEAYLAANPDFTRRDWMLPGMELERAPSGQYQKSPLTTRAEKKFNKLDADGNGVLDKDEVLKLAEWCVKNLNPGQTVTDDQIQAEARNIMEQCDVNKDELVDKAEFAAYYEEKVAAIQKFHKDRAAGK